MILYSLWLFSWWPDIKDWNLSKEKKEDKKIKKIWVIKSHQILSAYAINSHIAGYFVFTSHLVYSFICQYISSFISRILIMTSNPPPWCIAYTACSSKRFNKSIFFTVSPLAFFKPFFFHPLIHSVIPYMGYCESV